MEQTNEERKWIIYMYTFPSGKRYIGKTCQTLKQRQGSCELVSYKTCPVVWRAIQKYGVENIQQEVLFENYMPDEYASRLEMLCIALFKTNCNRYRNPEYGYNVTDGGEGSVGFHHSDETKKKLSEMRKNKPLSEETKSKLKKARRKRIIQPMTGKHLSNEAKEKISKAGIGRKHSEESTQRTREGISGYKNYKATAVYCFELNRVFFTLSEAQNETGADRHMVKWCCDGVKEKAKGLHWRYATQDEIIAEKQRRGIEVA